MLPAAVHSIHKEEKETMILKEEEEEDKEQVQSRLAAVLNKRRGTA